MQHTHVTTLSSKHTHTPEPGKHAQEASVHVAASQHNSTDQPVGPEFAETLNPWLSRPRPRALRPRLNFLNIAGAAPRAAPGAPPRSAPLHPIDIPERHLSSAQSVTDIRAGRPAARPGRAVPQGSPRDRGLAPLPRHQQSSRAGLGGFPDQTLPSAACCGAMTVQCQAACEEKPGSAPAGATAWICRGRDVKAR